MRKGKQTQSFSLPIYIANQIFDGMLEQNIPLSIPTRKLEDPVRPGLFWEFDEHPVENDHNINLYYLLLTVIAGNKDLKGYTPARLCDAIAAQIDTKREQRWETIKNNKSYEWPKRKELSPEYLARAAMFRAQFSDKERWRNKGIGASPIHVEEPSEQIRY